MEQLAIRLLIAFTSAGFRRAFLRPFFRLRFLRDVRRARLASGTVVLFVGTPLHGNLGDHAIVFAQRRFLSDQGLSRALVEVYAGEFLSYSDDIESTIAPRDLIVIDGGGNMGSLWPDVESRMQEVIRRFPNNPIVVFPQTVHYEAHENIELEVATQAYGSHPNLHICAREQSSYDKLSTMLPNTHVMFVPDIVLYLNDFVGNQDREGAIVCFRSDRERITTDSQTQAILMELSARGLDVSISDTVVPGAVTRRMRTRVLKLKLGSFSNARIVVTDRLHGMVFSAITGTPCIALDNRSGKVAGVFAYIEYLGYIRLARDVDQVGGLIDELLGIQTCRYDSVPLTPYYDELHSCISGLICSVGGPVTGP